MKPFAPREFIELKMKCDVDDTKEKAVITFSAPDDVTSLKT